MKRILLSVACLAAGVSQAQVKWDLPTGYAANTFQTQNNQQFAKEVDELTGGKLKITEKNSSVVVEISSDCGPVSVSEDVIDEELAIKPKLKPFRIALKLDAPASKGTVKLRILPTK